MWYKKVFYLDGAFLYLDEGKFAEAGAALCVSDGDLPIVFDPPSPAEDVVYTGGDFVPFIVISKPIDKQ